MYLLHVVPVLEAGLEHSLLQHPDHHIHVEALHLHPPQRLLDRHKGGAVCHRAPALLHLILDAVHNHNNRNNKIQYHLWIIELNRIVIMQIY